MKLGNKIISVFLCLVMMFTLSPNLIKADAATKNKTQTSISAVESKAKGFKVTWKKKSSVKGYQIQYSTSSSFKNATKKTVSKSSTTSKTVRDLKGCNVKYYVRVRTYKISDGEKVYSAWSEAETVKTLKHSYKAATCTRAKTCKYCDYENGKSLGHNWKTADDQTSKKCSTCGKVKEITPDVPNPENYHGHVYTGGSSSKKYHYEAKCAGKYSHEITWAEVSERGLTACGTCVLK